MVGRRAADAPYPVAHLRGNGYQEGEREAAVEPARVELRLHAPQRGVQLRRELGRDPARPRSSPSS